jgi:hypothetical protein
MEDMIVITSIRDLRNQFHSDVYINQPHSDVKIITINRRTLSSTEMYCLLVKEVFSEFLFVNFTVEGSYITITAMKGDTGAETPNSVSVDNGIIDIGDDVTEYGLCFEHDGPVTIEIYEPARRNNYRQWLYIICFVGSLFLFQLFPLLFLTEKKKSDEDVPSLDDIFIKSK